MRVNALPVKVISKVKRGFEINYLLTEINIVDGITQFPLVV